MTGPALSSPLVSTQWLADYLGTDNLVVVDATVLPFVTPAGKSGLVSGHEQYLVDGHIRGAVFADLLEEFSDQGARVPFTHQGADEFALSVGALGIDNDTAVVIYDRSLGQWASRLWWLFRANDYDRVAVLDGGYTKWIAEDRETDVGHVEPNRAVFTATPRPELWVTSADLEAVLDGTETAALVCALPPKEFSGEEGGRARKGHIPGSSNVPVARLINRETNAFLREPELREAFGSLVDEPRVVAYCALGIAATADALALTVLGAKNVAIYDGSMFEWSANENLPVKSLVEGS